MPGRSMPLVTDEIYHIFNRGIDRRPTFTKKREFARATETIAFYRFLNPPIKLSRFLVLKSERQQEILDILGKSEKLVEIYCYCLMPNHFHFLLKQKCDNGISKFLSNFQNSYTRYFNTSHERDGALFLDQFKSVRILTDEQLVHVSRYIHLNPYTSYVVKTFNELTNYPWSSLREYYFGSKGFVDEEPIIDFFKSAKEYKKFVFDQADYQRELKRIEHLILE